MEFSNAIFNYTFIARIPSLNSAMPAASFDVALSRYSTLYRVKHVAPSSSCHLAWQPRLFMCLCAVQLSTTPDFPLRTPCILLPVHPVLPAPSWPSSSQSSVCSLELLLQLLRLFGRLSVCSTLQQCHCSMVWYSIHVIPNISLYVLHIYAHLRGVLCS